MSNNLVDKVVDEILDIHRPPEEKSVKVKKEKAKKAAKDFLKSKRKRIQFPVEAFPTVYQEILNDWHTCTNIPVEYFSTAMLAAASVAIGNKVQLKITPTWYEAPVLYTAIIGPNGIGKSPVWKYALAPIQEINEEYHANHKLDMKNHYNNLALAASKKKSLIDDPPTRQSILIENATMEYLTELLFFNPNGVLQFRDEMKGWMMTMNQYRAGDDLQKWLEMWNNKGIDKGTKTAHYYIARCFITILGAIQPKIIEDLATDNNIANGLFQRFLFAYPYVFKRSKWSDKYVSEKYLKKYKERIKWIHKLGNYLQRPTNKFDDISFRAMKLIFSKEAESVWIKHYNWISEQYNSNEDFNVGGVYSKHDTYTARFALILRMLRYADDESGLNPHQIEPERTEGLQVEKEDIENAIEISKYYIHQSLRILESMESPITKLPFEYQYWYKSLPQSFTVAEARKQVEDIKEDYLQEFKKELEISDRTITRLLNNGKTDQPIFQKTGRGYYNKLWEV